MGVFMWIAALLCGAISVALVVGNTWLCYRAGLLGRGSSPIPLLSGIFAGPAALGLFDATLRRAVLLAMLAAIVVTLVDLALHVGAEALGRRRAPSGAAGSTGSQPRFDSARHRN